MQKTYLLACASVFLCGVLLSQFSRCPTSAKTIQEAMKEMEETNRRTYEENQRRVQAVRNGIDRANQKRDESFKSIDKTNRALLKGAGFTEYRHTELSNGRPVRTWEFKSEEKSAGGASAPNPQGCFSSFLRALRGASSFGTVKNYLDGASSSCTLESLKGTFGGASQIEKCNVNGKSAILTVKTRTRESGAGQITVRMKSDGRFWRVTGI